MSIKLTPIPHTRKGSLGEYLRTIRKAEGKSLPFAARSIGISKSHLSEIERDQSIPSLTTAARLAHYYDVHIEHLAEILLEYQEEQRANIRGYQENKA